MENRLGRGLEALIHDIDNQDAKRAGITTLRLEQILPNRYQPRKSIEIEALQELSESIRENGIIQPIIVTKTEDSEYELIAGERRLEAAKLAGLSEVPVIIRSVSAQEQLQLALIENIQREDLNAIDEAFAYQQLIDEFRMTHAQISQIIGKDRTTITNSLRLLRLSDPIRQMILAGTISAGHARAILTVEEEYRFAFAEYIILHNLSVRQAEKKAGSFPGKRTTAPVKQVKSLLITGMERQLTEALNSKTKIRDSSGKGKIIIEYSSREELNQLTKKLTSV